jgi:hypothetical protein
MQRFVAVFRTREVKSAAFEVSDAVFSGLVQGFDGKNVLCRLCRHCRLVNELLCAERYGEGVPLDSRMTALVLENEVKHESQAKIIARLASCGADSALQRRLEKEHWQCAFNLFSNVFTAATMCFHKGYSEHDDRSGGTFDAFCPCGCPVAFIPLPKQESAEDAVSMYCWFKQPPTAAYADNWCAAVSKMHARFAERHIVLDGRN